MTENSVVSELILKLNGSEVKSMNSEAGCLQQALHVAKQPTEHQETQVPGAEQIRIAGSPTKNASFKILAYSQSHLHSLNSIVK
jgi:hypothetical protein